LNKSIILSLNPSLYCKRFASHLDCVQLGVYLVIKKQYLSQTVVEPTDESQFGVISTTLLPYYQKNILKSYVAFYNIYRYKIFKLELLLICLWKSIADSIIFLAYKKESIIF
jgi:hypothetical protein